MSPKAVEREITRRGGAIRWRSKCIDGELWRVAITRRAGKRGGRTVMYRTGRPCEEGR